MVYQYSSSEIYKLDLPITELKEVVEELSSQYSKDKYLEKFFSDWILAFENVYQAAKDQVTIFNGRYFKENFFLNKNHRRIILHFNVDDALKLSYKLPVSSTRLSVFSTDDISNDSYIKYSHIIENNVSMYSRSEQPVILVQYYLSHIQYLVIDGNHRISAKKHNHMDFVNVVLIDPFRAANLMATQFERAFYLFCCEINNLNACFNSSCACMFFS